LVAHYPFPTKNNQTGSKVREVSELLYRNSKAETSDPELGWSNVSRREEVLSLKALGGGKGR